MTQVTLVGGPFDGAKVASESRSLVCEGTGVPDGYAANYRRTQDRSVYRFDGLTKIVARLPLPGAAA